MGGIPRGALSGPLQSPFSSLSRPGTTQSAPSTRSSCRRSQQGSSATWQVMGQRFFSLMVETSLMSKPVSRQDPIAKTA